MEKNSIMFSVIMPVYNVENYLRTAINSILSQTYTNFELILVDDCTPDSSGKICDEYAKKDSRVSVIHKPVNEGLGFARNTGMEHAKGEYILFVDSDDWLENGTLTCINKYLTDTPVDILAFGFYQDCLDKNGSLAKSSPVSFRQDVYAASAVDIAKTAMDMDAQRNFSYACSKAYSCNFLKSHSLLFDKTKLMEDFVFNIAAFRQAGSVRLVTDIFYHYIRPTHVTLVSTYYPLFFDLCKMRYQAQCRLLDDANVQSERHRQAARNSYIKHLFSAAVRATGKKSGLSFRERHAKVKEMLNDPLTRQVLRESRTNSLGIQALSLLFRCRMAWTATVLADLYAKKENGGNS